MINFIGAHMRINPIYAILHPVKTIDSALKEPDFDKAFFLVLMPTVLYGIFQIVSGLRLDIFELAKYGASHYLAWIFMASIIYFFAFLAKGKVIKGKFLPILSAISIIWLLVSILMFATFVTFYSSPKVLGFVVAMRNAQATPNEIGKVYNMLNSGDEGGLKSFTKAHEIKANLSAYMLTESEASTFYTALAISMIIVAVLLAYCLFLYPFLTLKKITGLGTAASFILYIITGIMLVPCMLVFVLHA